MATLTETIQLPPIQPDISYAPDFSKYTRRTQRRLKTEKPHLTGLPAGFPQKLVSKLVWEGTEVANDYAFVHKISDEHVAEIETALSQFKALNKPLGYINRETFPLPTLHPILRRISQELYFGHGFKVLHGLPVWRHGREDNIIMYTGMSSHIAPERARQDKQFDGKPADVVISHIKDLTRTADKDRIGAPAYTADKQVFHTDSGDIVSLLALSEAAEGGRSKVASSWRVYNELAETRPDLIETLARTWAAETYGVTSGHYSEIPLLHLLPASDSSEERVVFQYARRHFTGYQALPRSPNIPPITEAQAEALDALHFLAERFHLGLDFRQGDIQYLNNLSCFHARDGFKDSPEQQRHLVRLWLRDPEYTWQTPGPLKKRWTELFDGVKPENEIFPLEPVVRSASGGQLKPKSG